MSETDRGGRPRLPVRLFARGSWSETRRVITILHKETVGGALLLCAAAAALIWANSPWAASYHALTDLRVGSDDYGLHLNLSLGGWAADGLLAIFFFVVGLELKREFVAGDLRDPARAALPIAAAVGGMVVPAAIFVALAAGSGDGAARGWAIPTATDIAFAVAVLAVISTHLPAALRTFDRGVLYRQDQPGRVGPGIGCTDGVRGPGSATCHLLVVAGPLGLDHLGVRPRVRSARHGRRGAAGLYRAGADVQDRRARPGRAL